MMLVKTALAIGTLERQSFSNQWVWTHFACLLHLPEVSASLYLNQMWATCKDILKLNYSSSLVWSQCSNGWIMPFGKDNWLLHLSDCLWQEWVNFPNLFCSCSTCRVVKRMDKRVAIFWFCFSVYHESGPISYHLLLSLLSQGCHKNW